MVAGNDPCIQTINYLSFKWLVTSQASKKKFSPVEGLEKSKQKSKSTSRGGTLWGRQNFFQTYPIQLIDTANDWTFKLNGNYIAAAQMLKRIMTMKRKENKEGITFVEPQKKEEQNLNIT